MVKRQLPNALTVLRLVLAAAFFVVLNQYRYAHTADALALWILGTSVGLFILAALTDSLDGHLARKWNAESTFGRIMDPFCDKVLVIGALIYLGGPRFVDPAAVANGSFFTMVSGVYPWMVVIVLARELLVTGIRGELEGSGVKFGANVFGKLKMILQSIVVPIILVIVMIDPNREGWSWLAWLRDGLVYTTVAVTVLSGWPYLQSAGRLMGQQEPRDAT